MGICRFKTSEVKPLIEHALAATEFDMGYENMTDEQFAEIGMPPPTNRTPRGPALLFVHDRGVYLMSNGIPRLLADDQNNSQIAYAEGCNPKVGEFDDWYGMSRELVGGDDFVEVLPIAEDWSAHCDIFATFELDVSDTSISSRFTDIKARPLATMVDDARSRLLAAPISELKLSVRSRKCCEKMGITTIGQLIRRHPEELLECRGFGVTSLNEMREKLAKVNLTFLDDNNPVKTTTT